MLQPGAHNASKTYKQVEKKYNKLQNTAMSCTNVQAKTQAT